MTRVTLSAVVPVYRGKDYLSRLAEQFVTLRERWDKDDAPMQLAEVIFVDDAAVDASPEIIDRLAAEYGWMTAIHLSRNFGQHPATVAGILHTSGDWVVTLDEDLQHPPAEIETLLGLAVKTRSDVVYARPAAAVHENWVRDLGSRLYKRMVIFLSGNRNIRLFNSFRLIRGPIARAASSVCGHETYFDIALSWFSQRVESVSLELKDDRFIKSGVSGYRFSTLLSHARRLLMSSHVKITRACALVGLLIVLLSLAGMLWIVIEKLMFPANVAVAGWTSLAFVTIFFGGIITFLIGIVLEYLSALLLSSHGKPIFFTVDRRLDAVLSDYFSSKSP